MTNNKRQFEIRRNSQVCSGERACGECSAFLPGISNTGGLPLTEVNEDAADEAILFCPVGALEIKEV